jgi:phage gp45-like
VYELDLSVRNAGDGVLYRLNGHEILVITNREIRLDGRALDLGPGEVHEVPSPGASPSAEPPPPGS